MPKIEFPPLPALLSWDHLPKTRSYTDTLNVIWEDGTGARRQTVIGVDYDIDGAEFHYVSGDVLDTGDEECEELLHMLASDLSDLEGSRYIPIRPHYYRKAV